MLLEARWVIAYQAIPHLSNLQQLQRGPLQRGQADKDRFAAHHTRPSSLHVAVAKSGTQLAPAPSTAPALPLLPPPPLVSAAAQPRALRTLPPCITTAAVSAKRVVF